MPAIVLAREESFGSRREEPEEPKTMRAFASVASLVAVRDSLGGFGCVEGGGEGEFVEGRGEEVGVGVEEADVCGRISCLIGAASVDCWREERISA